MANKLYGYNPSNYSGGGAAASSLYGSRSVTEPYIPGATSFLGTTSKYLNSDSLSSSSALSSALLYNSDSYSSRIPGISVATPTHSYGPPGVDVGPAVVSTDTLYSGLKRPSAESKEFLSVSVFLLFFVVIIYFPYFCLTERSYDSIAAFNINAVLDAKI